LEGDFAHAVFVAAGMIKVDRQNFIVLGDEDKCWWGH
jgi:hypothetical protein